MEFSPCPCRGVEVRTAEISSFGVESSTCHIFYFLDDLRAQSFLSRKGMLMAWFFVGWAKQNMHINMQSYLRS